MLSCLLRRGGSRLGFFQSFFVGLLHVVVLPLDDRFGAEPVEVLVELGLALVGEHPIADFLLGLLERL